MAESLPSTSTVCNSSLDTQTVLVDKENEQHERVSVFISKNLNEFEGCCIYEKPKVFGESDSSSSSDDENDDCTAHCRGHKKKCYRHHPHNRKPGEDPHNENDGTSPQLDNDSTGPSSPVPQV
uniref:Protein phosphatase 1 regulatory subunit 11 n=1 Tax=Biomphalaria glabrata TaxID=6526 RepID=A0A2C9KPP5_BIOGL